jgi:hypothetical protein
LKVAAARAQVAAAKESEKKATRKE